MADLLSSLVVPNSPRSSQDSFRSLPSQPRDSSPPPTSSNSQSTSSTPFSNANVAFEATNLPVYDIDSYLTQNADLRLKPAKNNSKGPNAAASNPLEPVSLGTKSSHYVAALNTQCQTKGFTPVFEVEGITDFGGKLILRDAAITSDQRWPSKKDAREGLAEKGLEVVKRMEAKPKEQGKPREAGRNWVGMLLGEPYVTVQLSIPLKDLM